jgi:membrane-associated PAP2 superfamily phosphatase
VQDRLYRWDEGDWLVDRTAPLPRLLFYTGPIYIIGAVALTALALALRTRSREIRRHALVALLTIGSVPLLVGFGKDATNVFCPWDITRYGGDVPYVRVIERFPPGQRPARRGRGFPAGHASGGFALVALAGLAGTRRGQWLGIATGIVMGSTMGLYQMAKGAHYFSHTLVTAIFAWIVFLLWRRLLPVRRAEPPPSVSAERSETTDVRKTM